MNLLGTKEGNILLAQFMGFVPDVDNMVNECDDTWRIQGIGNPHCAEDFRYNTHWGWLMNVVEKIESLGYFCNIYRKGVEIVHDGTKPEPGTLIRSYGNKNRIENLWEACVKFVEWRNVTEVKKLPDMLIKLDENVIRLMILILEDVTENHYGNNRCNDFKLRQSFLRLIKELGVEVQHKDEAGFTVFDLELTDKLGRYLLKKEATP